MITGIPAEAWMAAGYGLLLAAVAAGLEWTARRVHRRSESFKTAGFVYHAEFDRWLCRNGVHLHRQDTAPQRARVYRAPAQACNRCALKPQCTDSERGRTLEVRPDAWIHSTMARFHRGLSLALLGLAELLFVVELTREAAVPLATDRRAAWALAALALVLGAVFARLARRFFACAPDPAADSYQ